MRRLSFYINEPDRNLKRLKAITLYVFTMTIPPVEKLTGGIGLSSGSAITLKDISLKKGNKTIYKSSFPADTAKWKVISGSWEVSEEGYATKTGGSDQPVAGQQQRTSSGTDVGLQQGGGRVTGSNAIELKDIFLENMTLSANMRTTSQFNNLSIRFAMTDKNNYLQLTISGSRQGRDFGGPLGRIQAPVQQTPPTSYFATLEQITKSGQTLQLGSIDRQFALDAGQWHSVEMTVYGKIINLSVDGVSIGQVEYKRPQRQFSIAGYDRTNNEVIIKVVNGEDFPFKTSIELANAVEINPVGQIIELSSTSNLDENDFSTPKKISPVTSEYTKFSRSFDMEFKPYSFTILRIKAKK